MNARPTARRTSSRRLAAFAIAATLTGTLVACGSGSDDTSTSGSPDPNRKTVLSIGSIYSPVNLDPAQATGIGQTQPYLTPIYDQLMQLDPEGKVVPMLAKAWEFSAHGTSLELDLRDDVTFSDGEKFNAEAVKANLERYQTKALPPVQTLLKNLDSVEVTGEYTVSLKLKPGGGAELPDSLAAMPGYMISPAALDNPDLDVNPVGSGPYQVEAGSFQSGQSITYVKKDGAYWGGTDVYQVTKLHQIGYADPNAGLNALRSGELDMMVVQVSDRVANEFSKDDSFNVSLSPTRGYYQIRINMENPVLADVRVRQAIAYALDRKAIGEVATGTPTDAGPLRSRWPARGATPRSTTTIRTTRRRPKPCSPRRVRPRSTSRGCTSRAR